MIDKIEEIKKLKSLLDQGAITLDEFNILKKNVLQEEEEKSIGKLKESSPPINIRKADIKKSRKPYAIGCLAMIVIYVIIAIAIDHGSSYTSSPSSDDRAVLYCIFCKKTVVEENGKDLIYYTNEVDGCAVHAVNSGSYNAFCSPQCCKAYRSALGQ